jgi:hypothetical protein
MSLQAVDTADAVVTTGYHLTARPWKPLGTPRSRYLDAIEADCRFTAQHQDVSGAVIDPFQKRELQYATPYFAYAVGTLVDAGCAEDLLPSGVQAMEHATACFAGGLDSIPDRHGNFFIAVLTEALEVYEGHVPEEQWHRWRERMKTPLRNVISSDANNWETYAMKGEWARACAGLVDRSSAISAIEQDWQARQHARIAPAPWFLYHDRTSDPDTLSVEVVGRGNLLALANLGYDGPSGAEIRRLAEEGTRVSLLLQDPSGQVPANGRTDDHVWVDVGDQLAFEVMAERMLEQHEKWLAGQYRRASLLAFQSIGRWRRTDGAFAGSYYVTKNHFDPALRVGYQDASQYSNYNGSLMFHLAEAYRARTAAIEEQPAPSEIGGYALELDPEYSSVIANAGGFQMQANLRGQTAKSSGNFWTPLGVVRFARTGWETRLGPSDGALTAAGGVTFAPEFSEDGQWLRLASLSKRYVGQWSVQFVHPLLVRCAIEYHPRPGQSGPALRNEFVLTPDGVFSTIVKTSSDEQAWGVTWPLLENDGAALPRFHTLGVEAVGYPGSADRESFIALDEGTRFTPEMPLRGTYGDLRPIRVTVPGKASHTFVYPSGAADPDADSVRRSIIITRDGFRSMLGRVSGTIYVGRTAAGGVGDRVDLAGTGTADATFSRTCGFLLQLRRGRVAAAETDRDVDAEIQGKKVHLLQHKPLLLPQT